MKYLYGNKKDTVVTNPMTFLCTICKYICIQKNHSSESDLTRSCPYKGVVQYQVIVKINNSKYAQRSYPMQNTAKDRPSVARKSYWSSVGQLSLLMYLAKPPYVPSNDCFWSFYGGSVQISTQTKKRRAIALSVYSFYSACTTHKQTNRLEKKKIPCRQPDNFHGNAKKHQHFQNQHQIQHHMH